MAGENKDECAKNNGWQTGWKNARKEISPCTLASWYTSTLKAQVYQRRKDHSKT
jgi:hypothetical protein